ncbi:hypothetical protein ACP3TJ_02425 [Desulforudis sp. 1088]
MQAPGNPGTLTVTVNCELAGTPAKTAELTFELIPDGRIIYREKHNDRA